LKTIYETHLCEGKFEVKRKIDWVLGVLGVVWVLGVLALGGRGAFRRCLGYWRSGVVIVLCISVVNLVKPKFSKKEKEQEKERAAEEERGEILRKGKETRKGKERGVERKKLLNDKWREAG
jgi:hypothetical protein